jgi:hypothetical protein
MGGPGSWSLRRTAALGAVIALHGGLLILLITLRAPAERPAASGFVSTFVVLSPLPAAAPRRERPRASYQLAPVAPVEPPAAPPPVRLPSTPDTSIDWDAQAGHAAAAVTAPDEFREFGHGPRTETGPGPPGPAHQSGEQYRLDTGEWVVWVSDRCYIVAGVPPIGLPDVLARSIPTSTVCRDDSPPPGQLFKELPAYQKYHAAPGAR